MSKAADRAAAAMGDVLSNRANPQPSRRRATPQERSKPVRITVDLEPSEHRALKHFSFDNTATLATVVRTLVGYLETDPALAERVSRDLRRKN